MLALLMETFMSLLSIAALKRVSETYNVFVPILKFKSDILRSLVGRGASVTAFPYDYPVHKVAHQ